MSLLKDEEAEARREAGWALGCSQPGKCFCHPQGDVGGEGKVQRGAVGINWTLRVPLCTPPPAGAQARPCSPSPATPHHRCPRLLEQVPTTFVLLQPLGFSSGPLSLTVK